MTSPRSWTVVVFEEDQTVQAVPTKWIVGDQCLWPTLPQDKLNSALKNCDYNTCWPSHNVRILRNSTFGDYTLARSKARKAEFTSDLSTDTEGHRKRKKTLFSSSDSDEDTINKRKNKTMPSLPPPPQMSSNEQCSSDKFHEEEICIDTTTETIRRSPLNRTILEIMENTPKQIPIVKTSSPSTSGRISNMKERSTTSCRNLCDVCCKKQEQESRSLYVVSSLLVELNGKMDKLIKRDVTIDAVDDTSILLKANIELPIASVPNLENFNLFLEEQKNYSGLVNYFSRIGGHNLTEFVKRCLAPLVRDELAIQYTYLGRRGKRKFGGSKLAEAIVDASVNSNLISNRKETELSIGAWFRRAPERMRRSNTIPI